MSEEQLQVLRGAGFVGAVIAATLLQRFRPHAGHSGSWRVNGGLWVASAVAVGVVCGGCAFTTARWATREGIGVLNWVAADAVVAAAVSLVALDLVSYGWHRANHRIALLWRFHQVHHSDAAFTTSTALRFHPGELLLSLPLRLTTVVALGAPAEAVLVFEIVFTVANLVEHGDIDLPRGVERRLERVLVTPALHRRHHTRGPERDSNYGTVFSIWDRLLGTYTQSDSTIRVDTGLPGLDGVTLRRALLLPVHTPGPACGCAGPGGSRPS